MSIGSCSSCAGWVSGPRDHWPVSHNAACTTIFTENVEGLRWIHRWNRGLGKDERDCIRAQAETIIAKLDADATALGISRPWNIKDMVMQIDPDTQAVTEVIALDWERVKLNFDLLAKFPGSHLLDELRPEAKK